MVPRPPRRRSGFTLVELLVVTVVIAILATIVVARVNTIRARAARSAVKSDLRNLALAQESYFAVKNLYTTDTDSLSFRASPGVKVTIVEATANGWSATGVRTTVGGRPCTIFYGNAAPPLPSATQSGVVECE